MNTILLGLIPQNIPIFNLALFAGIDVTFNVMNSLKKRLKSQGFLFVVSLLIPGSLFIGNPVALAQNCLQNRRPCPPRPLPLPSVTVPEPSSMLGLLALGAVGTGAMLTRKLKRKQQKNLES